MFEKLSHFKPTKTPDAKPEQTDETDETDETMEDDTKQDGGEDVGANLTVIVGMKHLTPPTTVFLPHLNTYYPCVVDLSANGFDKFGRPKTNTQALLPTSTIPWNADTMNAFVDQQDDPTLNAKGGKRIWITELALSGIPLQAPFDADRVISVGERIDDFMRLPTTLFHELLHTILLGTLEKRSQWHIPIMTQTNAKSSQ